jgi:glutaredoxin
MQKGWIGIALLIIILASISSPRTGIPPSSPEISNTASPVVEISTAIIDRSQPQQVKAILLFSRPGCIPCNDTRKWFREHNITWQEYDIRQDEKARSYALSQLNGIERTPFIEIQYNDGGIYQILGFVEPLLRQKLIEIK